MSSASTSLSQPVLATVVSQPTLPPSVPPLDNTFGAFLLGSFVGLLQFGFLLHQIHDYLNAYPRDVLLLKCIVFIVLVLECITLALNIHTCYFYLITNRFNPSGLLHGVWSIDLLPVAVGLRIIVAQSFFARRVFLFDRRYGRMVAVVAATLFLVAIGMEIASTVVSYQVREFSRLAKVSWSISGATLTFTVADIFLTSVLVLALRRSLTGIRKTDSMVDTIIMYSVNTGLLISTVNVLVTTMSLIYPSTLIYVALAIVGTGLYSNTLLATLNSRNDFAKRGINTFGAVTNLMEANAQPIKLTPISSRSSNTRTSVPTQDIVRPQGRLVGGETPDADVGMDMDFKVGSLGLTHPHDAA